jgi:CHAT domain-containing protein
VRTFNGKTPPASIRLSRFRSLCGVYPNDSLNSAGHDVETLRTLVLKAGLSIDPIDPVDAVTFLTALKAGDFDVLHIACHGRSKLADIDRSELIISDRSIDGRVTLVTVDAKTVRSEARLANGSLVFLNACETGRPAPSLTDWGGWPRVFFDAGAGAFVGTSWSVRKGAAAAYSEAFYGALLSGSTLLVAARQARESAKQFGDASWLAYVVYGAVGATANVAKA